MPIRIHVSHLSDTALREKLGIKRRAKPRELERQHQVALIKWVRAFEGAYPVLKLLYAVPNSGNRNLYVARKLKAEGVRAGVADLCLPTARRGYHGLYLEMKSEDGTASKEQKEFLRGVSEEGYCAIIARGVEEAHAALEWYLGLTENEPVSVSTTKVICQPRQSGRKKEQRGRELRVQQRPNDAERLPDSTD
jgi:VRR-NUC domain